MVVAIEQSNAPRPNVVTPAQYAARAPTTAASMPAQLAATMDEARNAVVGQLNMATPPSSPTMDGNTVVSISTFIDCSSTPPNRTASVGIHSRLRSDRHPARTGSCRMPVVSLPGLRRLRVVGDSRVILD